MGFKTMANASNSKMAFFRHVLRSTQDALYFSGAPPRLGNPPAAYFVPRRELVEVSHSQIRPTVFNTDRLRERLREDLKGNKNNNNNHEDYRLWMERIRPPESQKMAEEDCQRLRKFLRMEVFKARVQKIPRDCIDLNDLLKLCMESVKECSVEEAMSLVKLLNESGQIFVLNQKVHLRPHKLAEAMEKLMTLSMVTEGFEAVEVLDKLMTLSTATEADPRSEELANLEKEKAKIDQEAEKRARAELQSGLGFGVVQTAILMRLTFWELSWDVMEPICFFLTSIYFMAGYAFFLRTSINPTFDGFFKARFRATQKRLMKKRNFDVERFNELQQIRQHL